MPPAERESMTGMANTPAATIMSSAAAMTRFGAAIAKRANACSMSPR